MTRIPCARASILILILSLPALPASAAAKSEARRTPGPASVVTVLSRAVDELAAFLAKSFALINVGEFPAAPTGDSQGTMDPNG
jgi:hypothetical protein